MIVIFPIIVISSISIIGVIVKVVHNRHRKTHELVTAKPESLILMINGNEFRFPYETNKTKRLELAMEFCSSQGISKEHSSEYNHFIRLSP